MDENKIDEFEILKQKYEQLILQTIKTFINTNDENFVEHKKPHFYYFKLAHMVVEFCKEGYVNLDEIDKIIAPAMIDDYRIYNNALTDYMRGYESRSDGFDNVMSIIYILANTDYTKFPRLKDGLINHVLTEKSQPVTNMNWVESPLLAKQKFEIETLKKQYKGRCILPEELYQEIFGEPNFGLSRVLVSEANNELPFS